MSKSCSARAGLHEHAGVHHVHALAHAGDDAEIVRDQDQRGVLVARRARAAGRGSAPGSSRRARSSARRRSGASARTRAPSRSSRAGASRRRTDADSRVRRDLGARDADLVEQLGGALVRVLPRQRRSASASASRICRPIVSTGLSDVIGSWKIIAISRPRTVRSSPVRSCSRSRPPKSALPLVDAPGARQDPEQRERGDALAAARLADDAERLARRDVERDAVDGVDRAALGPELDPQVLDRRAAAHVARPRSFGSSASRRPSPIRLKPSTEKTIATPGMIASHGAVCEVLVRCR